MTQIFYMNALSGAGKTFSAVKYARGAVQLGEKIILAQPTLLLNDETVKDTFAHPDIRFPHSHRLINSRTAPNRVNAELIAYFTHEGATGGGKMLTTTQAAVLNLKYAPPALHEFTLIIDEEIEIVKSWNIDVPEHHRIITDHLEVEQLADAEYWPLRVKGTDRAIDAINAMADNESGDQVNGLFQQLCQHLRADEDWSVFVNGADYQKLLDPKEKEGRLRVHAELSPTVFDKFKRVIVMSACFTELLMYKVWEKKVTFTPFIHPSFKLRFDQHSNGHLIDVYYLFGGNSRWSKTAQDRAATDAKGNPILDGSGLPMTNLDLLIQKASKLIGSDPVAIHANKEESGRTPAERYFENGIRLPSRTEGMNRYQHIHNIVLLGAFNPPPWMYHFLDRHAGISADDIYRALTLKATYQAINRISIRDPNSTKTKIVVVATETDADYILSLYPGAKKRQFTADLNANSLTRKSGRKPLNGAVALTPEERKKRFIEQRRYKNEVIKERLTRVAIVNDSVDQRNRSIAEKLIGIGGSMEREYGAMQRSTLRNFNEFHGTLIDGKTQTKGRLAPVESFDQLCDWLNVQVNPNATCKEEGVMISPCHYANYNRSKDSFNHAFARHIILDFEEGKVTPRMFADLFPEWRMTIWSSWNSRPDEPRFRVLIETDRRVDLQGYKLITREVIVARLRNQLGLLSKEQIAEGEMIDGTPPSGCHGLDWGKSTAKSFFYVPCIGEHHNFFYDHREGRVAMNVEEVLRSPSIPVPPIPERRLRPPVKSEIDVHCPSTGSLVPQVVSHKLPKQRLIDAALEKWRTDGDRDGHRNSGLYDLALSLVFADCDDETAERIINEVAHGEHANCGARLVRNARVYKDSRHV